MGLSYVASLPITSLCPTLAKGTANASIGMAASFAGAGAVEASFSVSPPTVSSTLAQMSSFQGDISTAIGLGLPSLSFSVSDCLSLTSNLNLSISTLPTLSALLTAAAGIFGFTYVGTANAMGAALSTQLASTWPDGSSSSGTCTALIFGTVDSTSTTQFSAFLSGLTFGTGLTYAGHQLTISGLCPAISPALPQASGALSAQLSATAALQASLAVTPPTLAASLAGNIAAAADLSAAGALAPPSFVVSASASLAASLSAQFGALITLGNLLSRNDAVAFVYHYTGAGNALGAAVTTALTSHWGDGVTPTSGGCTAVILGATDALTTSTMLSFFGGA